MHVALQVSYVHVCNYVRVCMCMCARSHMHVALQVSYGALEQRGHLGLQLKRVHLASIG